MVMQNVGTAMKTKSFEPALGELEGFNIPHAECYSLVEFLRVGNDYRPGCHYSYLPCESCRQITTYGHNINRFSLNMHTEDQDHVAKKVLRGD